MKQTISLNGDWRLAGFDHGAGDWSRPDCALPPGAVEIDAHVPGEVHVDLLRAGLIPDPYYATNADQAQWVEQKEWWYRRTFEVPEDLDLRRAYLEFDGLDTFATVFLNGAEVGRTNNMFVPHRFDVSGAAVTGTNTVAIRFEPAVKVLERIDTSGLFGCFDTPRVAARKMQCSFGWDWTHRLVGAGIWRGARLVCHSELSISDVYVHTEIEGGSANAWVSLQVENHSARDQKAAVSIVVARDDAREKIEFVEAISPFGGVVEALIRIDEPELWWPNGAGEQPLYKCMVGVQVEGEVQDVAERDFGVRDVRLIERDEAGRPVFTLLVNGQRIFCKGGNWIPADHFVSNVTQQRYRELVELAADAGFNMLRVWGGGIYEDPAFYRACDEMGIMVWQDFMFSCGLYPDDEDFRAAVASEVETVVRQLRNHPSVVLWCGNNECEMGFEPDAEWPGKSLFHQVIPAVLARLDTTRPYRPSSPLGGPTGNDASEGDLHRSSWFAVCEHDAADWRRVIEQERGLFHSEFVTQGPPMIESIREFVPPDSLFPPTNEVWEFHNKDNPHSTRSDKRTHQQILVDLTRRMMGEFTTAEEFAAYAGILQGEFIKAEVEHYRREKWAISGALMWMYNDCWPAVGWSIVDYYLRPKIAYYYTKRAFAPVIVSFRQIDDAVQAWVTSDNRLANLDATLQVGVFTFDTCGLDVEETRVRLPADESARFWESGPLEDVFADPSRQCLVAMLRCRDEVIARNVYFPRLFREMQFPRPRLLVAREQIDERRHALTISADGYARNVAISGLPPGTRARVSDNYFDLLPGEIRQVRIDNVTADEAAAITLNVWAR